MSKKNSSIYYDKKSDALWIKIKAGVEVESKEVAPGVNIELGKNKELLGIEVLNASKVLGKKIYPKIPTITASV